MKKVAQWTFLLLVFSLPVIQPFDVTVLGLRTNPTDYIFVLSFVVTVAAAITLRVKPELNSLHLGVLIYLISLMLSAFTALNLRFSLIKLAAVLYLLLMCLLSYFLTRNDRSFGDRIALTWVGATVVVSLGSVVAVLLFYFTDLNNSSVNFLLSHYGSLPEGNYPRVHSLFANANMLANYLNTGFVMTAYLWWTGRIGNVAASVVAAVMMFTAVFSFSTGLGGIFVSAAILLFAARQSFSPLVVRLGVLACVSGAVLMLVVALVSPPRSGATAPEKSVRVVVWQETLQGITARPLLGVGVGNDPVFVKYTTVTGQTQILRDAHNVWLNVAGQSGLVGLFGILCLTIVILRRCRWTPDQDISPAQKWQIALSSGFAGAFLYQGLTGSFEDARHLWVLFGLIAASGETETSSEATSPPL